MNVATEVETLIKQDLNQKKLTDDIEIQKKLNSALAKLIKVLFSNLETLKNPVLSNDEILEKVEAILAILGSPIKNLPALNDNTIAEFRTRLSKLVVLYDSIQESMYSKLTKTGPREQIKSILNLVGITYRESIASYINNYLWSQRDILANYIALYNALEQAERLRQINSQYPEAQAEIIILKRHEVCSELHKGFGLVPDTGLDAFHFGYAQSEFELSTSKSVQNQQVRIMKELGIISRVQMIVSPVTRAYETALHATLSPSVVDSLTVDNHFAEEQFNTSLISSGRAYRFASDVANDFIKAGYKNVSAKEDFLIVGENRELFYKRRAEASKRILANEDEYTGVTMKIVVAHGGINNAIIAYLKENIEDNNIPDTLRRLDYGAQYNLITLKDKNQNIIILNDSGIANRYGLVENTSPKLIPVNIKEDDVGSELMKNSC